MINGYIINRNTNHRVKLGDRLVIGRGVDADLCIDDRVASRSHVEIVREKMGFAWRDLGSRNGTLINGVYETAGRLHDGDHIRIGETDLIFEMEVSGQRMERIKTPPPFEKIVEQASNAEAVAPQVKSVATTLDALYRTMAELACVYDTCRLQDRILDAALTIMKTQRAAIFLANELLSPAPCPLCGHSHGIDTGTYMPAAQAGLNVDAPMLEEVLRGRKAAMFQRDAVTPAVHAETDRSAEEEQPVLCVPLRGKTRILGVLCMASNRLGEQRDQQAVLLASALGASAGLALENAFMHQELLSKQRVEQESEAAWSLQDGFLCRDWNGHDDRFEIFGAVAPAKLAGGDFYDFVHLDANTIGLAIGDVSGKGIPSALTMTRLLSAFRVAAKEHESPAAVLSSLNEMLCRGNRRGAFCTMIYARFNLETGAVTWANAGHPPAMFLKQDTNVYQGEATGPPLGVNEEASWQDESGALEQGETVVYYTNGVTEARPPGENSEPFGMARLWTTLEYGAPPELVVEDVNSALANYLRGTEAHDDCAMLVMRYRFDEYLD